MPYFSWWWMGWGMVVEMEYHGHFISLTEVYKKGTFHSLSQDIQYFRNVFIPLFTLFIYFYSYYGLLYFHMHNIHKIHEHYLF